MKQFFIILGVVGISFSVITSITLLNNTSKVEKATVTLQNAMEINAKIINQHTAMLGEVYKYNQWSLERFKETRVFIIETNRVITNLPATNLVGPKPLPLKIEAGK